MGSLCVNVCAGPVAAQEWLGCLMFWCDRGFSGLSMGLWRSLEKTGPLEDAGGTAGSPSQRQGSLARGDLQAEVSTGWP